MNDKQFGLIFVIGTIVFSIIWCVGQFSADAAYNETPQSVKPGIEIQIATRTP